MKSCQMNSWPGDKRTQPALPKLKPNSRNEQNFMAPDFVMDDSDSPHTYQHDNHTDQ